jgi:hypothetical protein
LTAETSKPHTDLAALFASGSDQELSEKIAKLESQLEMERDSRREDRFVSLVLILALIDIILLGQASAAVTGVVFVLQLLFFVVVAKRMGVEQIAGILDRILDHVARK